LALSCSIPALQPVISIAASKILVAKKEKVVVMA
jgi:hypothetical protein